MSKTFQAFCAGVYNTYEDDVRKGSGFVGWLFYSESRKKAEILKPFALQCKEMLKYKEDEINAENLLRSMLHLYNLHNTRGNHSVESILESLLVIKTLQPFLFQYISTTKESNEAQPPAQSNVPSPPPPHAPSSNRPSRIVEVQE